MKANNVISDQERAALMAGLVHIISKAVGVAHILPSELAEPSEMMMDKGEVGAVCQRLREIRVAVGEMLDIFELRPEVE